MRSPVQRHPRRFLVNIRSEASATVAQRSRGKLAEGTYTVYARTEAVARRQAMREHLRRFIRGSEQVVAV